MDTTFKTQGPQAAGSTTLRHALRANGVFSTISGAIFLIFARPLSTLTGIPSPALAIIGVAVLGFAAVLLWATSRPQLDRRLGLATFLLDVVWVIATLAILLSGWPPLTAAGKWIVGILGVIVADFALWEYIGLRRQ